MLSHKDKIRRPIWNAPCMERSLQDVTCWKLDIFSVLVHCQRWKLRNAETEIDVDCAEDKTN